MMSWLAARIHELVGLLVAVCDGLPPLVGLTVLSCVTGVFMLWVVGLTTSQQRVERARAQIAAAIYEMRLFIDSPRRILAAQGRLFAWFAGYMGLLLPAFVLLSIPLGIMLLHLETRHGLDPLPVDAPVVVRLDITDHYAAEFAAAELPLTAGPAGDSDRVRVTAPPLYIESEQRVYLRVRIAAAGEPGDPDDYRLVIDTGRDKLSKRLSADPDATPVRPERRSGIASWWQLGDEQPLSPESGIAAIVIAHPDKPADWLPLGMPWWAYWLLLSTVVALALRRPMGVAL